MPPMEAENASPADVTTAKRPRATWRSAYSDVSPMYTMVSGMRAPAKAPARSRAATNCQVVSDSADSTLQALKPSAAACGSAEHTAELQSRLILVGRRL